ncbi:MAG: RnfABCDGE type electron transport complex subunit D [Clostridia bacterium]
MQKLICSASPHVRAKNSTRSIMIDVCIALAPAVVASIIYFGLKSVAILLLSVIGAFLGEMIFKMVEKKKFKTFVKEFDFTTIVTGLLLGLNMPPFSIANGWYIPLLSGLFAIIVVKMLFGGTGYNFVNPAIAGRVFALISFTLIMTQSYVLPNIAPLNSYGDISTGATALTGLWTGTAGSGTAFNMGLTNLDLFLGTGVAGSIGETSKLAILIGGLYLFIKRVVDFRFPLIYIVVTGLCTVAFNGFNIYYFLPSILSGGLFLGAIFMATDYVTSPNSFVGNLIYFTLLGFVTALLRQACKMEVVSFVILLMNLIVPLINRYIYPRPFGYVKQKKTKKEVA